MVNHNLVIVWTRLKDVGADTRSPSRFVRAALSIAGVREAFRVSGRYDAVVLVHSEDPKEGENERIVLELQKLPNVAWTDVLTGYPTGREKPNRTNAAATASHAH